MSKIVSIIAVLVIGMIAGIAGFYLSSNYQIVQTSEQPTTTVTTSTPVVNTPEVVVPAVDVTENREYVNEQDDVFGKIEDSEPVIVTPSYKTAYIVDSEKEITTYLARNLYPTETFIYSINYNSTTSKSNIAESYKILIFKEIDYVDWNLSSNEEYIYSDQYVEYMCSQKDLERYKNQKTTTKIVYVETPVYVSTDVATPPEVGDVSVPTTSMPAEFDVSYSTWYSVYPETSDGTCKMDVYVEYVITNSGDSFGTYTFTSDLITYSMDGFSLGMGDKIISVDCYGHESVTTISTFEVYVTSESVSDYDSGFRGFNVINEEI
jgi:hypothetical protein